MLREEDLKPVTKILERHKLFFSSKCFQHASVIFHLLYKKANDFQISSLFAIYKQGLGVFYLINSLKAWEMVHLLLTQALISQRSQGSQTDEGR